MKASSQPIWIRNLLRRLSEVNYARVELVIFTPEAQPEGLITQSIHKNRYLLFSLYNQIEKAWFTRHVNVSEPPSVEELTREIPILRLQQSHTDPIELFSNAELQQVQSFDLDVILCLNGCQPKQQDCHVVRYGLWALQDLQLTWSGCDNLVGFWEVIEHRAVTKCSLKVWLDGEDRENVITQSFFSTNPDSVTLNQHIYLAKMSALVLRELRLLWEANDSEFQQRLTANHRDDSQPAKNPTNRTLIVPLFQHCLTSIKRRIETRLFNHQWFLAFSFQDGLKGFAELAGNYTEMVPPSDRLWADPFPVCRDGKYYLFFEELLFRSGKGHLSVTELQQDGTWSTPKVILKQDCHLSYPFIFNWQGSYYMIPETSQRKSIELYKCVEWPHEWKIKEILMSGVSASDTTICEIEGLWWMFVAMAAEGTRVKDELLLYYSENPLGPWIPHKRNPVVSDVRNSRPAGRLFESDGVWMRPAQDCSGLYGGAIAIMEIVRISPYEYIEKESVRIEPQWSKNLIGTHTWNSEGNLTVIDGCRKRLKRV